MGKIFELLGSPKRFALSALYHFGGFLSDKTYIKWRFRLSMGKFPNLDNPQSFSEKLQWLKLHDHNPQYRLLADKVKAKEWAANIIGEEHIIPNIGVWDSPDEIDFDGLPNQFALKCNHNSGTGMFICKDKSKVLPEKWEQVKAGLLKGLKEDYSRPGRDWCYIGIPKKILAEKYMVDESGTELKDYKFFCFDGVPKYMFVAKDRNKGIGEHETKFDFFDMEYNHLPITNGHPNSDPPYFKPKNFEEMKEMAAALSKGIPQVRVDLYNINGQIYFGEMTFYHWGGMKPFEPEEWDYKFGENIQLPKIGSKDYIV